MKTVGLRVVWNSGKFMWRFPENIIKFHAICLTQGNIQRVPANKKPPLRNRSHFSCKTMDKTIGCTQKSGIFFVGTRCKLENNGRSENLKLRLGHTKWKGHGSNFRKPYLQGMIHPLPFITI